MSTSRRIVLRAMLMSFVLLASSVLASAQTEAIEYYHLDALGSVRAVTNQAGAVIERHDYLPFGDELTPPTGAQPVQFTGQERDAETGMDYFGARYYSGKRGRFTTIDPVFTWQENLTDPQRWNRYAYVRNNPLRHIDPDGREIWSPFQSAKPADFAVSGGVLKGLVMSVANALIGANSPGHGASADRFFAPSNTAEAVGMVAGELGLLVTAAATRGRPSSLTIGEEIGILRDAARGRGNFGLGTATADDASRLGEAWVGKGYSTASDGKTLISQDMLRQYRPPSFKPNLNKVQANFEQRSVPKGGWGSNGHLDISR